MGLVLLFADISVCFVVFSNLIRKSFRAESKLSQ